MKNFQKVLAVALCAITMYSCSDDVQTDASVTNPISTARAAYGTLVNGHGNILFKLKTKKSVSRFISATYTHGLTSGVVNYTVADNGSTIVVKSPINETVTISSITISGGIATFNLTAKNSSGIVLYASTNNNIDEDTLTNLRTLGDRDYADATVIALLDLLTYGSSSCIQSLVPAAVTCEANGGVYELSLRQGFFNNTCQSVCN